MPPGHCAGHDSHRRFTDITGALWAKYWYMYHVLHYTCITWICLGSSPPKNNIHLIDSPVMVDFRENKQNHLQQTQDYIHGARIYLDGPRS